LRKVANRQTDRQRRFYILLGGSKYWPLFQYSRGRTQWPRPKQSPAVAVFLRCYPEYSRSRPKLNQIDLLCSIIHLFLKFYENPPMNLSYRNPANVKQTNKHRSKPYFRQPATEIIKLEGRISPYCKDMCRRYCCLTSFFPIVETCLSCEDIARRSCAMVPGWRFLATFLRPVFAASREQHNSDLHSKFALGPRHV